MTGDLRPYQPPQGGGGLTNRLVRRLTVRHERRPDYSPRPQDPGRAPQPITLSDFRNARAERRYLKRRWSYYCEAIAMVQRLAPRRILEIGCRYTPLFPESDRMDYLPEFQPTILHDATVVPWPIPDQAYDLVMALQVWEHLDNRQREAFGELPRIARYAVLSLPFKWRRRSNPSHSGIDDSVVARWTGGLRPLETVQVPVVARHKRKIYLFDLSEAR